MGKRNLEALRQKHQSKFKKSQTKKPANSQPFFLSKWKTKGDQHIKSSTGLQEAQGSPEENQARPSVSSPSKVAFPIESSSNELSAVSSIEDKTGYGTKINYQDQPVSGLVEPKQTKLSPRISSNELAREIDKVEFKKKKLGIFSKIWMVILFVLGIIASMYSIVEQWKKNADLKRMEEAAAISRMLDSYGKDQDLKSDNRPEWIAKKEEYQFHITYDDITSLFSDFTSSVPNLTKVDEVVAKLGKAESGRETNQDNLIKTIDLNYSQAGTEAKVKLSFKSYLGPSETLKLESLKCTHLSSAQLPNRNAQLTRQDLSGIEKGKTYQEIVSQLGLPERLDWHGGILSYTTLSISYRLEDGQEVSFSFEKDDTQSYRLKDSSGLASEAGEASAQ